MKFPDCQNPNIKKYRNPSMHETCKRKLLLSLIKNIIMALVRPLSPKGFPAPAPNNVCLKQNRKKEESVGQNVPLR